jgi:hypothetical protein
MTDPMEASTVFDATLLTRGQKVFYGFVLALAAVVGVWGLFLPLQVDRVLPFLVPPLHARFLGSMYLSGATFMALGILAKRWAEMRIVTPMIAIWTGTLCVVSLFYLELVRWSRVQVWIWFLAYTIYPLVALWIAWRRRKEREPGPGGPSSRGARTSLTILGVVTTALAVALLVAPAAMTAVWPWRISPVLAQIYGAPFLSYGIGSWIASRPRPWSEARIVVISTAVFTLLVLGASIVHRGLFDPGRPATWVWFGGLFVASVALLTFAIDHARRRVAT